jgi:hypothetical protein
MGYYKGDYYRGDPGIFGDIWSLGKKVIGGVFKATPLGQAVGAGVSMIPMLGGGGRGGSPGVAIGPTFPQPDNYANIDVPRGSMGAVPTPGIGGMISRTLPGGMSGYSPSGRPPVGYHINKAIVAYERSIAEGGHRKQPMVVHAVVKNRQMNPLNPRALRRAARREGAAVSIMKRVLRGSGYTFKRTGAPGTKKRRAFGKK